MKKDIELGQEKDPGKWAGTMTRDEDRDMDWKRDKVKDRDMVKVGYRYTNRVKEMDRDIKKGHLNGAGKGQENGNND